MAHTPGDGITGGYTGNSLAMKVTIATLAGITWYNALELIILIFVTFSRYRGTYFWSLLVSASLGLLPYSIGFFLKFFQLTPHSALSVTCITVGWWCMVTGQSVVLYSRLHLVVRNPRVLNRVRALILVDAVVLHVPTTVLTYGSNMAAAGAAAAYTHGYNVMEKIQMTGFCLQEFLISGLYIWETVRMLRLDPAPDRGKRKIMYQLVAINLLIIGMDVALLVVEYMNRYILETMLKGVIYSIKLKLEFAVLGKLVFVVRSNVFYHAHGDYYQCRFPHGYDNTTVSDLPDFVDASRLTSDLTHAPATIGSARRSHPWMDSDDVSIAMFEHSETTTSTTVTIRGATGNSSIEHSWSGETCPLDFTDSLQKQRCSLPDKSDKPG